MSRANSVDDQLQVLGREAILAPLRLAYGQNGPRSMYEMARQALVGPYERARVQITGILDQFYGADSVLDARDRERVVIALLASRAADPVNQAIHHYWGLMERLSPQEIAETLLLVSAYCGVDAYASGISCLLATLRTLGLVVESGSTDLSPPAVIRALRASGSQAR